MFKRNIIIYFFRELIFDLILSLPVFHLYIY